MLTPATPGRESRVPMKGSCRKNETTTGKKSLLKTTASEERNEYLEKMLRDAPKQVEETKSLDEHSKERPLEEDE